MALYDGFFDAVFNEETGKFDREYESGAFTDYFGAFASAIAKGNAYGVQFHPEKSGDAGLRLLENFTRI